MANTVPSDEQVLDFLRRIRQDNPSMGTAKILARARAEQPNWTIDSKRLRTLQVRADLEPSPEGQPAPPLSTSGTRISQTSRALPTTSEVQKRNRVVANEQDPDTMSTDTLIAFLSARGLFIPTKENNLEKSVISDMRRRLTEDAIRRPDFDPIRRWLYIPQNPNEPCRPVSFTAAQIRNKAIEKLLNCRLHCTELLYSEDQIAIAKGSECGVGLGHLHRSWELFMDDNAVYDRPLNPRASRLLGRPNTHGPVLVSKAIFQKVIQSSVILDMADMGLIAWEPLDELELEEEKFQKRRKEWIRVKYATEADTMEYMASMGFQFMSL